MAVFCMVRGLWRRARRLLGLAPRCGRPVVIDLDTRAEVLSFATEFTSDPTSAILIVENARALLEWLSEADSPADLKARLYALRQHSENPADDGEEADAADNAQEFLKGAGVLYRFLAGTPDAEPQELLGATDEKLHAWMDGDKSA